MRPNSITLSVAVRISISISTSTGLLAQYGILGAVRATLLQRLRAWIGSARLDSAQLGAPRWPIQQQQVSEHIDPPIWSNSADAHERSRAGLGFELGICWIGIGWRESISRFGMQMQAMMKVCSRLIARPSIVCGRIVVASLIRSLWSAKLALLVSGPDSLESSDRASEQASERASCRRAAKANSPTSQPDRWCISNADDDNALHHRRALIDPFRLAQPAFERDWLAARAEPAWQPLTNQ